MKLARMLPALPVYLYGVLFVMLPRGEEFVESYEVEVLVGFAILGSVCLALLHKDLAGLIFSVFASLLLSTVVALAIIKLPLDYLMGPPLGDLILASALRRGAPYIVFTALPASFIAALTARLVVSRWLD